MADEYRTGSLDEFFAASKEAVRTGKPMKPKRWYGSEEIRRRAEERKSDDRVTGRDE